MKFINIDENENITTEITYKEFRLIRQLIGAVLISCKDEISILLGCTADELMEFGGELSKLSNEYGIDL